MALAPPSGTVAFLFTDIEGSTRMWDAHPAQMRPALARHDAILRSCAAAHHGHVFKTVGDAFCVAFTTATDAAAAAIDAQLALSQEPWPEPIEIKVRMAVHVGEAETRDDDYFGPPLNRVARLLAAGHGGQILLSEIAQGLCRDALIPPTSLRGLGEHRLKDLGRPEGVHQLTHPELPSDFPALRSLGGMPNNLPQQPTSFVGRERELTEITTMLGRSRLVTLTGSGGSGKTRLALQSAADVLDDGGDGVWLVELAPLAEASTVALTTATVLGVRPSADQSVVDAVASYLAGRRLHLVLDNCEHLLGACAELAEAILRRCPGVTILATSREPLGIQGEATYRVPSLSLPPRGAPPTADYLSQFEAVRLFIDRAQAHQPAFQVDNQNAPAVASICVRLDGIPFAIELAAARVRAMPVDQIEARLGQRFRLLTGGARTALPRQQTLRSLIDWSHDMLGVPEKTLLRRLSVFAGGWDLAAAEAVCVGDAVEEWEVLDLLTGLADKSLVVYDATGSVPRYGMLETVRQFAAEKLADAGEQDDYRDRHLAHFLAVAEDAEPLLQGADQIATLDRLELDHANMAAAGRHAIGKASPGDEPLRLVGALWIYWDVRKHYIEAVDFCRASLASSVSNETLVRSQALYGAGVILTEFGLVDEAEVAMKEGLDLATEQGDLVRKARFLSGLAMTYAERGEIHVQLPLLEESLRIRRELADSRGVTISLNNLAIALYDLGRLEEARELHLEACEARTSLGDPHSVAVTQGHLGRIALDLGEYDSARTWLLTSCETFFKIGDPGAMCWKMKDLGKLAEINGRFEVAGRIWGAADRMTHEIGWVLNPVSRARDEASLAALRAACEPEVFEAEWNAGRLMSRDEIMALLTAEFGDPGA